LVSDKIETGRAPSSDSVSPEPFAVPAAASLPEPVFAHLPVLPTRRRLGRIGVLLAALILAASGGGYYWWQQTRDQLPAGIAWGNGRLEADEIDIDTKFAGRIAAILVQEGDMVKQGQVIARMDTSDLDASLKQAQAQAQQAQGVVVEAHAAVDQQRSQAVLAKREFDRTASLAQRGHESQEMLDQRRQQLDAANAALNAATARVAQAEQAQAAAQHQVEIIKVNIADNTLVAPRDGRVQYRIANLGEVLPAGGKVVTMIDIMSVYIDIFLPTLDAGRIAIGSDARIVLDAYPKAIIPAKVSFVASDAQFTPKTVETQTERDRLMFRIRVRIDPALLQAHAAEVRSGLPGIAYVRLDPKLEWPARFQPTI
jgi:HlyD family secretion protein